MCFLFRFSSMLWIIKTQGKLCQEARWWRVPALGFAKSWWKAARYDQWARRNWRREECGPNTLILQVLRPSNWTPNHGFLDVFGIPRFSSFLDGLGMYIHGTVLYIFDMWCYMVDHGKSMSIQPPRKRKSVWLQVQKDGQQHHHIVPARADGMLPSRARLQYNYHWPSKYCTKNVIVNWTQLGRLLWLAVGLKIKMKKNIL